MRILGWILLMVTVVSCVDATTEEGDLAGPVEEDLDNGGVPDGDDDIPASLAAIGPACTFDVQTLGEVAAIDATGWCMAAKWDPQAIKMGSFTHDEGTGAYIWRVNWSAGYELHAYLDLYEVTRNVEWLHRFARQAKVMLDQRDSVLGILDYKGNQVPGWQARARSYLGTPYTYNWLGFNAHVYYPMMRFAALVQETPALKTLTADNVSFDAWSSIYVSGFLNMIKFSAPELRDNGTSAHYVFESNVPDDPGDTPNTTSLRGKALPVNMASAVFGAYLVLGRYYAARNDAVHATKFKGLSARYLTWLRSGSTITGSTNPALFETRVQGSGSYLVWKYATYMARMEDIGHSNLTYRYMLDARILAQSTVTEQVRLENTFLRLDSPIITGLSGSSSRFYLDSTAAPPASSHTSFYLPLAVRAKATLEISAIWIAQQFDGQTGLFYFGALALAHQRGT